MEGSFWPWFVVFKIMLLICLLGGMYSHAYGEEPHSHEGDVGQFYMTWMRPENACLSPNVQEGSHCGHRKSSCCNKQDCHGTQVKKIDGRWQFWDYWSWTEAPRWRDVPDSVLEHNQPDPRESPDGQNHVCASPGHVFCAVFGSGQ
jgi:hypothetical protein